MRPINVDTLSLFDDKTRSQIDIQIEQIEMESVYKMICEWHRNRSAERQNDTVARFCMYWNNHGNHQFKSSVYEQ